MTPRATARLTRLSILSCRQHDDHEVILDYSHHPPVKLIYIFSQDWGASCDVDDVSIKWHIPSLEEKTFAKELLETFLLPVLDRLTQFTQGNEMTRYVLRHLSGKKPVFHLPPPPCHGCTVPVTCWGGGGCSIYRLCILLYCYLTPNPKVWFTLVVRIGNDFIWPM